MSPVLTQPPFGRYLPAKREQGDCVCDCEGGGGGEREREDRKTEAREEEEEEEEEEEGVVTRRATLLKLKICGPMGVVSFLAILIFGIESTRSSGNRRRTSSSSNIDLSGMRRS